MENCIHCGAQMYKYGGEYFCPNCDEKQFIKEESDELDTNYIG